MAVSTRDGDFEPWWEEKGLGAPPPPAIADEIRLLRRQAAYEDWKARGMPLAEVTPDPGRPDSGIGFVPGGMPVGIKWVQEHQRVG